MGAVGVHHDDPLVLALERPGEGGAIRAAEAALFVPADEVDPPVAAGEAGDDVTCSIGGVVVHDDHIGLGVQGEQGGEQGADVLSLVVRGNRDEEPAGRGHVK